MKKHSLKATVFAEDKLKVAYSVCELEQVYYEDETYEYIFTPDYAVIALLEAETFQGIPGINLGLKKKQYVRKNKIPTFIYERVPQANREDLWELLDEVGLEYLDHLEWLIRTDKIYAGDNLRVFAFQSPKTSCEIDNVNHGDVFTLKQLANISADNFKILKFILEVITKGAFLKTENFEVDDNNRKSLYTFVYLLYENEIKRRKRKQRNGISNSKEDKKYLGRKRIEVSLPLLDELINKLDRKEITVSEAMNILGLNSRSTFNRRVKELRASQV